MSLELRERAFFSVLCLCHCLWFSHFSFLPLSLSRCGRVSLFVLEVTPPVCDLASICLTASCCRQRPLPGFVSFSVMSYILNFPVTDQWWALNHFCSCFDVQQRSLKTWIEQVEKCDLSCTLWMAKHQVSSPSLLYPTKESHKSVATWNRANIWKSCRLSGLSFLHSDRANDLPPSRLSSFINISTCIFIPTISMHDLWHGQD